MTRSFLVAIAIIASSIQLNAQTNNVPMDYLGVPGPIHILDKTYELSWSAHPSPTYFKQEYLVNGDNPNHFESMVMMEAVVGILKPQDAPAAKVGELKQLQAGNPLVRYESIVDKVKQEFILTFTLSANGPDGKISILERNVYRYTALKSAAKSGVQLFAVSTRAYDAAIQKTMSDGASVREVLEQVRKYKLPPVEIK